MKSFLENKKIIVIAGILISAISFLIAPFSALVNAADAKLVSGDYGFVYDQEDLLTDEEERNLQDKLEEIGEKYDVQLAVVTTSSYSQITIEEYADDMMDYGQLGMKTGNNDSAVLLAISMQDREYHISTRGEAILVLTDNNLYSLEDMFVSYLSSADYSKAFSRFASGVEYYFAKYETRNQIPIWKWALCLVMGLVCGGITVFVMSSGMKNVKSNNSAANYEEKNNVNIVKRRDFFIRKNVSRVAIEHESRSQGGGSSTHHSSSGNSHGGHGGHF